MNKPKKLKVQRGSARRVARAGILAARLRTGTDLARQREAANVNTNNQD